MRQREYQEELGADPGGLILLGRLTPLYVFASNFLVTPCVGVAATQPRWRPNGHEVDRVVQLPVPTLLDQQNWDRHVITRHQLQFTTSHINCEGDRIWVRDRYDAGRTGRGAARGGCRATHGSISYLIDVNPCSCSCSCSRS